MQSQAAEKADSVLKSFLLLLVVKLLKTMSDLQQNYLLHCDDGQKKKAYLRDAFVQLFFQYIHLSCSSS